LRYNTTQTHCRASNLLAKKKHNADTTQTHCRASNLLAKKKHNADNTQTGSLRYNTYLSHYLYKLMDK